MAQKDILNQKITIFESKKSIKKKNRTAAKIEVLNI